MKLINIRRQYKVRSGISGVSDFNEVIQKALDEKQKSKSFKDVGTRVGGSRKEQAAYETIRFEDLSDIERDTVAAERLVTKDRVWPVIDAAAERERGVSSGAAYLKVQIRKNCAAKPSNDKNKRASYVRFLTKLAADLEPLKKTAELYDLFESYRNWKIQEVIKNLLGMDVNVTDERAKELLPKQWSYMGLSYIIPKIIGELCGKSFVNFMYRDSDAARQAWSEANNFAEITQAQSLELVAKFTESKARFIEENEKTLESVKTGDGRFLQSMLSVFTNTGRFSKDLEGYRAFLINYYTERVKKAKEELENPPKRLYARPENWEWADLLKTVKTATKSAEIVINTGVPLAYIKRVGGLRIDEKLLSISVDTNPEKNPITSLFGFNSVQFGNYVKDNEAKEHIRHFLGAAVDLAETLNIDLKEFNQVGGLSIAFGARGKGRAMAHYERGYKIINLTKGQGDGTLSHEWCHYLDNIITMLDTPEVKLGYASDFKEVNTRYGRTFNADIKNEAVKSAMIALMKYIENGKNGPIETVRKVFFAIPREKPYSVYMNDGNREIVPQGTPEETFTYYQSKGDFFSKIAGKDLVEYQEKVIGKLVADLGLNHYTLELTPKSSTAFYYNSSRMKSEYWTKPWELMARAWETYVYEKLRQKGRYNNYLVSETYFDADYSGTGQNIIVYPYGTERSHLIKLFDNLIDTLKKEYRLKDFAPFSQIREDEFLQLSPLTANEVFSAVGKEEDKTIKNANSALALKIAIAKAKIKIALAIS